MGKSLGSLGCLLLLMGLSLPFLMFCGIAVVATLEQSIGTFLAWAIVGLFVVGIAWLVRNIVAKNRPE